MNDLDDTALLAACRGGDEAAWRLLLGRYGALILSVPRRYGLRAAEADEVFAEVCLILVRSLGTLRDPKSLPQWLIRTSTRATWEHARRLRRATPPDLPELTGAAPPESLVERFEEEQQVRDALGRVGERCRRLLELLYFTDPPPDYDGVAKAMSMPRGSLGPTRRRCLEKMKAHLGGRLGGDVSDGATGPPRGRNDG